jgi:iron complex transport system substrate-binding protein
MKRMTPLAVLAAVILIAGCGGDGPTAGTTTTATGAATTITAPGTPSTATPTLPVANRIVSLSPTATETLFAIGAGNQVLAVDAQSNYPPEAMAKRHDLSALELDVDVIAELRPDLVVIADDSTGLTERLEALGLTVWSGPAATSLDDAYDQIEQLGAITGHDAEAAALVTAMQSEIDAEVNAVPPPATPLRYYHERDNTYSSITENTFIGQVYSLFGLQSIADFQEVDSDYPKLSADVIIDADPDFIFLADGESAETVAARPGWESLKAVINGNVVVVDGDISSRWGPRTVDYVKAVRAAVAA